MTTFIQLFKVHFWLWLNLDPTTVSKSLESCLVDLGSVRNAGTDNLWCQIHYESRSASSQLAEVLNRWKSNQYQLSLENPIIVRLLVGENATKAKWFCWMIQKSNEFRQEQLDVLFKLYVPQYGKIAVLELMILIIWWVYVAIYRAFLILVF